MIETVRNRASARGARHRQPVYRGPRNLWNPSTATVLLVWAATLFSPAAHADDIYNPRTTFGEVGILEMPSARTAADGQLSFTIGDLKDEQRYNFGFQILPWLEGSFRYSHIPHFANQNFYDRSFGLKIRLGQEGEYIPEISLGMRDFLGTGVYSGEYLVASKRIWDIDLTFGVGWGRFAQSNALPNPLAEIFSSFKTRSGRTANGGTVNFGQLFHGEKIGLFGGAIWRTPIDNLELLVEYSSDRYNQEATFGSFSERTPVNIGLAYRPFDAMTVSAGWYYGTTYGLTISMAADPTVSASPLRVGPTVPQAVIRTNQEQILALNGLLSRRPAGQGALAALPWVSIPASTDSNLDTLTAALTSEGEGVRAISIVGHTLLVDARPLRSASPSCGRYAQIARNIDRSLLTVAVSDLQDTGGRVALCPVAKSSDLSDNRADDYRPIADSTEAVQTPLSDADRERKIRDALAVQSITTEALSAGPANLWLYYSSGRYLSEAETAGRAARVLMAFADPSVEIFHLISIKGGLPLREFQISRSALERSIDANGTTFELGDAITLSRPALDNPILDRGWGDSYPRFHWNLGPALREGLFDPSAPLQVQLLAALNADVELTPRLEIDGRVEANIYNNFDLNLPANSLLPHVRSDAFQYFRHGINGIAILDAAYRMPISRDVFAEVKAGYFESMFAGVGGQVLWQPDGGRISVGADLYEVWQRSFDRLFSVQSYHVLTGHVSVYYASPWYDLNFNIHAGRYLAGDYGATFEITRRFSTGVEIGAFATFTNVPFSTFGEGSFDKGIIIHIPFEWALPYYSQSSYDLVLRSLTRDGGQRLLDDDSLHDKLQSTSYGEIQRHLDEITTP